MLQSNKVNINIEYELKLKQSTKALNESRKHSKPRFSKKKCLLPLSICISPMAFFPYECARDRTSPLKNVHKSHIKMMKVYTLPFCHEQTNESRGRWERKEDMTRVKDDA